MTVKKSGAYPCPRCGQPMHRNGGGPRARWVCESWQNNEKIYCYSTTDPTAPRPRTHRGKGDVMEGPPTEFRRKIPTAQTYIITSAQNATAVHAKFWEALLRAADHFKAELIVIPLRYRNPTAPKETDENGKPRHMDYWEKRSRAVSIRRPFQDQ